MKTPSPYSVMNALYYLYVQLVCINNDKCSLPAETIYPRKGLANILRESGEDSDTCLYAYALLQCRLTKEQIKEGWDGNASIDEVINNFFHAWHHYSTHQRMVFTIRKYK